VVAGVVDQSRFTTLEWEAVDPQHGLGAGGLLVIQDPNGDLVKIASYSTGAQAGQGGLDPKYSSLSSRTS
jgi:hypothetical protein